MRGPCPMNTNVTQIHDSCCCFLAALPCTTCPNEKWPPKQIAIIQRKLISFVWNFRHNSCKSSEEERHINFEITHSNVNLISIQSVSLKIWSLQHSSFDPMHRRERPLHFLDLKPAPQLNQLRSNPPLTLFTTAGFAIDSTGLIKFRLWRRLVSVRNSLMNFFHSRILFLTQNFNCNFIFFAENHCFLLVTQQWCVNDVNIAGTRNSRLYRYLKNHSSSKFDFFSIGGSYF